MGYKSKVKAIRKMMGGDKRPHSLEDMIECPVCHAWSYPRGIRDPKNETEKKAVLCGSCHRDLMPFIEAKKREAERKNSLNEEPINPQDAPVELFTPPTKPADPSPASFDECKCGNGFDDLCPVHGIAGIGVVGQIHHMSFDSEEARQKELDRLNKKRDAFLEKHPEL